MTHDEWLVGMKGATACMERDPERAAGLLRDLVSRVDVARQLAVSSWHVRESQGLLAQLEVERGAVAAAAEINELAARDAHAEHRAARHAAAWRFAEASLQRFKLGEVDKAMALAEQAFALADVHADPGIVYERLVAEVRRVRQAKS